MILIGQYDSPFVRRVGIALTLYEVPFEHRPWSVFGDAEKVRQYNPLVRVPTLVLDDETVLVESGVSLDYLDGLVPAERAMFPATEPARHRALRVAALATGGDPRSRVLRRTHHRVPALDRPLQREVQSRLEPAARSPGVGHRSPLPHLRHRRVRSSPVPWRSPDHLTEASIEGWLIREPYFQCNREQRLRGVQQHRLGGLNSSMKQVATNRDSKGFLECAHKTTWR